MQLDTTTDAPPIVEISPPGERQRPAVSRARAWAITAARPIGVYATSRVVVLAAMWMASRMAPPATLRNTVVFWDSGWYLQTASAGYPQALPIVDGHVGPSTFAFFPVFPLCIRAVHALGLSYLAAGLVVAGVAGAATVVVLWVLLRRLWGDQAADRGVALFCFFPGAFVLSGTYAEPLMLALSIGCLLALLSQRWVLAGVLAAVATGTTSHALALAPACAWAAVTAIRQRRQWRALVAPLLAPVGFVAFMVFLWNRTGVIDAYMQTHHAWDVRLDVADTWHKFRDFFRQPLDDVNITIAVAGTVFLAVTLILLVRARPPAPVLIYTLIVVLPVMISETLGARPRFLLTAFPLVAVLGRGLRGNAFAGVLAASATVLGCLTVVSVHTFLATP